MSTNSPSLSKFSTTEFNNGRGTRHETDQGSTVFDSSSGNVGQTPIIQIVIGVCSAIVLSLVVIICVLCLRNKRKQIRRKSVMKDLMIGLESPNPFAYTLNSQLMRGYGSSYNALDLIAERQQEVLETEAEGISHFSSQSSDTGNSDIPEMDQLSSMTTSLGQSVSMESFDPVLPSSKRLRMMRRCRSTGNVLLAANAMDSGWETNISINLNYDEHEENLNVTVSKLSEMPPKAVVSDIYVMAFLFPILNDGIHGSVVPGDDEIQYDELFQFKNVSFKELEKCTLRLSIFVKKRYKTSKDSLVGEAFLLCSDVDWKSKTSHQLTLSAQRKRLKKHSTPDKHLFKHLGELFVLLQYQHMAKRIKVFLRRAEHLPKSDKLLGSPVHYVIINLMKDGEIVDFRETSSQAGYNPVWNQPFLFDIKTDSIGSYSLVFRIMRGKLHTKDGIIGQVVIGQNGPKSGANHWQEMLRPFSFEVAKWHSVLPVFKY